jgi:hypothetical protein
MFRPVNSSESNLFTIRVSIGYGSPLGVFGYGGISPLGNGTTDDIIASNSSSNPVTQNFLASPASSNLPSGFYIQYLKPGGTGTSAFRVTYGKEFTSQPFINIIPQGKISAPNNGTNNLIVSPSINKSSLTYCDVYLPASVNYTTPGDAISQNGTNGILGFDLIITGPVKMGVNSGNSNKGWAVNDTTIADPTCVYSSLDVNLGSTFGPTVPNSSVIISKNLKLLGSDNNILAYTASTSTLDYTQTIWKIYDGVNLTTLTPQKGMILIIYAYSSTATFTTSPTITLASGKIFNYTASNLNKLTFGTPGDSVTLYGDGLSRFIILNKSATVSVTVV